MSEHHTEHAKNILKNIRYATIATASSAAKPWNSPVAHSYDEDLNIYWFSDKEKIHSQNVRENENVFIVIYDSTLPNEQAEGVYIEAKAYEVEDPEIIRIARRAGGSSTDNVGKFLGESVHRCYKAVPQNIWINDAEKLDDDSWRDYRVEIPIDKLAKLMK